MSETAPATGNPSSPGALAGLRVLVSRPTAEDPFCRAVEAASATAVPVRLTRTEPAPEETVRTALAALEGTAWVAFTSARTVVVLTAQASAQGTTLAACLQGARIAAVGPATATALEAAGVRVDFVPEGSATAQAMVAAWPQQAPDRHTDPPHLPPGVRPSSGRVVIPGSALSSPTLPEGLRAAGWQVETFPVYTTVALETPQLPFSPDAPDGWPQVVFLTAGSQVRALTAAAGCPPPSVCVVTIGQPSARVAAELGLAVCAVATDQSPAGMVAAAEAALQHRDPMGGDR